MWMWAFSHTSWWYVLQTTCLHLDRDSQSHVCVRVHSTLSPHRNDELLPFTSHIALCPSVCPSRCYLFIRARQSNKPAADSFFGAQELATVWELLGVLRGRSPPHLMSSTPYIVVLVYLSWEVRCNPHRPHLQLLWHTNVKNTQFSCQHMGLLKLKMHQNPFSAGAPPRTRLGELTTLSRPPSRLGTGEGDTFFSFPPRRLRRLASDPLVLFG